MNEDHEKNNKMSEGHKKKRQKSISVKWFVSSPFLRKKLSFNVCFYSSER